MLAAKMSGLTVFLFVVTGLIAVCVGALRYLMERQLPAALRTTGLAFAAVSLIGAIAAMLLRPS